MNETKKVRKIKLDKDARRAEYLVGSVLYQAYIPEGFKGRVKSSMDILTRARALLAEEGEDIEKANAAYSYTRINGHWTTGKWFKNHNPKLDPEDAYCNSWQVCMDGALLAVSVGQRHDLNQHPDSVNPPWSNVDGDELGPEMTKWVTEARVYVAKAAQSIFHRGLGRIIDRTSALGVVTDTNDHSCKSRTQALLWLDKAIQLATEAEASKAEVK